MPGTTPKVGEGSAKTFTYTVEVENGIDTSGFSQRQGFARMVTETLDNPEKLDAQPAVHLPSHRRPDRQARLPDIADLAGHRARGLRL